MEKNKSSMTALTIFYVAFAVTVLLAAGLVIGLPTTTIQQAQATTSPSQANEHISEQGRAHQSERGAERSGVSQPVFCSLYVGGYVDDHLCFETAEECEEYRELFAGYPVEECKRFEEIPSGAVYCWLVEPLDVNTSLRCGNSFP